MKIIVCTIDVQKYLFTKKVRHNGIEYKEFKNTDIKAPDIVYIGENGKRPDEETYRALLNEFQIMGHRDCVSAMRRLP